MSKHLQRFVDNFLKGAALGTHWMDQADKSRDRKEARDIAREKNRIDAGRWAATDKINQRRTDAYERDINAKIGGTGYYDRSKGGRGGGGAGGGGLSANSQAFVGDMANAGIDVAPTPDRQPTQAVQQEAPDQEASSDPPEVVTDGYARGGRTRNPLMGSIMAAGQRAAGQMARSSLTPAPPQRPTITRGPSQAIATGAPTALQGDAGTAGPGSGYGDAAPPPVTGGFSDAFPDAGVGMGGTYRRGGPVRRFAEGGIVPQVPEGFVDDRTLSPEERQQRWRDALYPPRRGSPTPTDGRGASDDPPGRSASSDPPRRGPAPAPFHPNRGGSYGQANAEGSQYGGDDRERAYDWAENTPGRTGGGRSDRRPASMEPTPRGIDPPFYGEEDRANETPRPRSLKLPPLPTGMSVPGQDYPTNTAEPEAKATASGGKGGGGGGGRGAIRTDAPWKKLGDQTRDAAYDPYKDMDDERNIHATDPDSGRTRDWVNQRVIMDDKGTVARVENPVGAAANYVNSVTRGDPQKQMEVHQGAGAPDPRTMDGVMKVVDPDGTMQPHERMEAAYKATHDWYAKNGDEKGGAQAAAEVAQYGVQQSRSNGVNATKALQKGDVQGAVNELIAGYGWLPNGQQAVVQGGNIQIVGKDGKVTMSIPINQQTVQNLALGMATGKLGWDVMGMSGGPSQAAGPPAPPPGREPQGNVRPSAQPPAATAGPNTPPAAAIKTDAPMVNIGAITEKYAGPSAPDAAPPPRSQAPQNGAPPRPTATSSQQGQKPPDEGAKGAEKATSSGKEGDDGYTGPLSPEERAYLQKNPRRPLPINERETQTANDESPKFRAARAKVTEQYVSDRRQIMDLAIKRGVPKNEFSKVVTPALNARKAQYDKDYADVKAQEAHSRQRAEKQEDHDRNNETKPRPLPSSAELSAVTESMKRRAEALDKDATVRKNSVFENLTSPNDRQRVHDLALELWRQNPRLTPEQALDHAVTVTNISPNTKESPMNMGKDRDALQFTAKGNARNGYSLRMKSGNHILVDKDTHQAIINLHQQNYTAYEKRAAEEAKLGKVKKDLVGRAGRAIRDVIPQLPPGTGPLLFPTFGGR